MKKTNTQKPIYGIIGLGRFGMALATQLAAMEEEIIVVDQDEAKVRAMRMYTDNAYAVSYTHLDEEGGNTPRYGLPPA